MGTEVAKRIETVRELLKQNEDQFRQLLPASIPSPRFLANIMAHIEQNPSLLECSKSSVIRCILQAAQLGGMTPGPRRQIYFVPYKEECALIIGYQGMMTLARNSGEIAKIEVHEVYEGDGFEYTEGLKPTLHHSPGKDNQWRNEPDQWKAWPHITAFYAIAWLRSGLTQFAVMTRAQVENIKNKHSKAQKGPWKDFPIEMGRKTVLRELCNMLPSADEKDYNMARAVAIDKAADAEAPQPFEGFVLKGISSDEQEEVQEAPTGPRFPDWYGPMAGKPLAEGTDNHLEQYLKAVQTNLGKKGREGFKEADEQAVKEAETEIARRKSIPYSDGTQPIRQEDGAVINPDPAAGNHPKSGPQQASDAPAHLPTDFAAWCNDAQEQARDLYYSIKDELSIKSDQPIPVAKRKAFYARFQEERAKYEKKP